MGGRAVAVGSTTAGVAVAGMVAVAGIVVDVRATGAAGVHAARNRISKREKFLFITDVLHRPEGLNYKRA